MPASPIVEVKNGAGPWVATTGGVDVTPGNTISIRLAVSGPVTFWFLEIFGVDEVTASAPVLTGVNPVTHQVTTPATVVTFVMPSGVGIGRALVFRSSVDSGGSGFTTTFGVYTLTGVGDRVGAVGEKFEGNSTFGWVTKLNPLIRNPTTGTAGGDLGGSYPNPTVLKINGTSIPVTGVPDIGKSLIATGAGTATWQTAFTAGGDLSGTISSQTVEKVKGTTVTTAGGALTPGYTLKVTGAATADWQPPGVTFQEVTTTPDTAIIDRFVYLSGAASVLDLPAGSAAINGMRIVVKNGTGSTATINRAGADTIDGATSYSLLANQQVLLTWHNSNTRWLANPGV